MIPEFYIYMQTKIMQKNNQLKITNKMKQFAVLMLLSASLSALHLRQEEGVQTTVAPAFEEEHPVAPFSFDGAT